MNENDNDSDVANFSAACTPGEHVLVAAHLFDEGGTHYLRKVGLGPTLDSDPPGKTVFFLCKILKLIPRRHCCRLKFLFDNEILNIADKAIYRKATVAETNQRKFYVFRPGTGLQLHECRGVIFEKGGLQTPKIPQRFKSNTPPADAAPRWRTPRQRGGMDPPGASIASARGRGRSRGRGRARRGRARGGRGRARGGRGCARGGRGRARGGRGRASPSVLARIRRAFPPPRRLAFPPPVMSPVQVLRRQQTTDRQLRVNIVLKKKTTQATVVALTPMKVLKLRRVRATD